MFNINDFEDGVIFGCEPVETDVLNAMSESDPIDYSKIETLNVYFRKICDKIRSEDLISEKKATTTYVG